MLLIEMINISRGVRRVVDGIMLAPCSLHLQGVVMEHSTLFHVLLMDIDRLKTSSRKVEMTFYTII